MKCGDPWDKLKTKVLVCQSIKSQLTKVKDRTGYLDEYAMGPHDESHIIIELWNVSDEVEGIPAEDYIKNIVTKLRQLRGVNVVR